MWKKGQVKKMSEKNVDKKGRHRNVNVGFRVSPQEAEDLNVRVALSGLSKQEYIMKCLTQQEIRVVCGRKVAREMQMYLEAILEELQFMEEGTVPEEEVLLPLQRVLEILEAEEVE